MKWKLIYIKVVGICKKVRRSIFHQCILNYRKIKGKIRRRLRIVKIYKYCKKELLRGKKRKKFYILSMEMQWLLTVLNLRIRWKMRNSCWSWSSKQRKKHIVIPPKIIHVKTTVHHMRIFLLHRRIIQNWLILLKTLTPLPAISKCLSNNTSLSGINFIW